MKFFVPNYSCLQNPWLRGYRPQIPVLSVLCPQLNVLNPTKKNSWVRHWSVVRLMYQYGIKGDYIEKQQSCFISVTLKGWSGRKLLDPPSYNQRWNETKSFHSGCCSKDPAPRRIMHLFWRFWHPCEPNSVTLKMVAAPYSETSKQAYYPTRCNCKEKYGLENK